MRGYGGAPKRHTLFSIIRHDTGEQRRERLQSQKVNTDWGRRNKKKKGICDIISWNMILQNVVSKNKYWNFSRLLVKLQKREKLNLNYVSYSGFIHQLCLLGTSLRMITNLYFSNESLHLNCEFSHNSHNHLGTKKTKEPQLCCKDSIKKNKKKKQLSMSRASSKSPFHIHIVIQAWSGFDLLRSSHCKCKYNRFFSSACDLVLAPEGPPVWIQQENLQNSVHSREQACSLTHTLKNTRHTEWWRAMFNCKCAKNISSNWRD